MKNIKRIKYVEAERENWTELFIGNIWIGCISEHDFSKFKDMEGIHFFKLSINNNFFLDDFPKEDIEEIKVRKYKNFNEALNTAQNIIDNYIVNFID